MMRSLVLATAGVLLAAPAAHAGPGEVTAVSVIPGSGRAQVVIDVHGTVSVQDFTLEHPTRLVLDVTGATLATPTVRYDGVNRAGILNIRYSQFRPDVVRVVLQLDALKDYHIDQDGDAVRVSFGTDQSFGAWSSLAPADQAAPGAPATGSPYAYAPPPPAVRSASAPQGQPRVTVTYDSASIADVMAGFAAFSGRTILLGKDVKGTVTAEIHNQPWDVAFKAILESQGLTAVEDSAGIIRVESQQAVAALDSLQPVQTKLVRVNYVRAAALVPVVKAIMSKRGQVVADTATNSLIITDVETRLADDSAFVSGLDIRTPQVSIHAKLIFVDRTDIENLGVQYDLGAPGVTSAGGAFFNDLVQRYQPGTAQSGTLGQPFAKNTYYVTFGGNALAAVANASATIANPALKLLFSTAIGSFDLTSFVQALEEVDLADLQAEPVISTADNTLAQIQVGERTPIRVIDVNAQGGGTNNVPKASTQIVPTGIILKVTPHVTAQGQVLMQVHAENSSLASAPADIGFTFKTQQADNQLLVNDGETAVVGGLTVTDVSVTKTGIPFLVDLPILGRLFGFTQRREERRDLLILVTPHIIDDASGS